MAGSRLGFQCLDLTRRHGFTASPQGTGGMHIPLIQPGRQFRVPCDARNTLWLPSSIKTSPSNDLFQFPACTRSKQVVEDQAAAVEEQQAEETAVMDPQSPESAASAFAMLAPPGRNAARRSSWDASRLDGFEPRQERAHGPVNPRSTRRNRFPSRLPILSLRRCRSDSGTRNSSVARRSSQARACDQVQVKLCTSPHVDPEAA